MEFVQQILIKLEMSSILGFRQSTFEVLCGVISVNTAVTHSATTQTCTIRALPVPEIEALSLTKLHTSGGRRNM